MLTSHEFETVLATTGVVPVLRVNEVARAGELARVLAGEGLSVIEVTLRTPEALGAIRRMREAAPHALVGAGTVLTPDQVSAALDAGAAFVVSPGLHLAVLRAARQAGLPAMPGVATASEVGSALDEGATLLKFFPASLFGGVDWIVAMAAPYPTVRFVPTGGLEADDLPRYLAHSSVAAVGGSWIAPARLVDDGDFTRIAELARKAVELVAQVRAHGASGQVPK